MNGSAIFVFQGNREKSYATITLQITELLICLFFSSSFGSTTTQLEIKHLNMVNSCHYGILQASLEAACCFN